MHSISKVFISAALALALQTAPASAQFLTFVSATGDDTRPCTVQAQPCKTLKRAVEATAAGGEVRLLSSLSGQKVGIGKPLTLDGGGNTMVGTFYVGRASPVTLRNLSITGRGELSIGIFISGSGILRIEGCSIERYEYGIYLSEGNSKRLFVSDSVSRDNAGNGLGGYTYGAKLTIDNSRFENNLGAGLHLHLGGQASVTGSVFSGNGYGVFNDGGSIVITHSTAAANIRAGFTTAGTSGSFDLVSSTARGNGAEGLSVRQDTIARISDSVFTNNGIGIDARGEAYTLGNNLIFSNGTNVDGALTPLPPQ